MLGYLPFLVYLNKMTFSPHHVVNRWRLVRSYVRREATLRGQPTIVHLELTNVCNLHCPICPSDVMRRLRGFMDATLFKKIVDELSRSLVEIVFLQTYGESLIHKQFRELATYARQAGLVTALSTNATRLDENAARSILASGIELLVISYDSEDPHVYETIRRGAKHSIVHGNIERFLRLKGSRPPMTVLQAVELPQFGKQKPEMVAHWEKYDVVIMSRPAHEWLGDSGDINAMVAKDPKPGQGVCDQPWRHPVILWDGSVVPCCNFYDAQVVFGNVGEQSLLDIWNGPPAQGFRRRHSTRPRQEIPECATCQQPGLSRVEQLGVALLDQVTANKVIFSIDGWPRLPRGKDVLSLLSGGRSGGMRA